MLKSSGSGDDDHEMMVIHTEESHHDDTVGLIGEGDLSDKERAQIKTQKLEAVLHSRERMMLFLKRGIMILLFVLMLGMKKTYFPFTHSPRSAGATSLYVIGPGNENFDAFPLADVSVDMPYVGHFEILCAVCGCFVLTKLWFTSDIVCCSFERRLYHSLLSWPRYQVEVEVKAENAPHAGMLASQKFGSLAALFILWLFVALSLRHSRFFLSSLWVFTISFFFLCHHPNFSFS